MQHDSVVVDERCTLTVMLCGPCRYLQQHHAAITIATAGSLPPSAQPASNSDEDNTAAAAAAPAGASSSSAEVQASRQLLAVLGRGGMGGSRDCRLLWLAPLEHQMLPGNSQYVIGQDLRTVLDITQDNAVRFQKWVKLQQQEVKVGLVVRACEVAGDHQQQPDQQRSASWLLGPSSPRGLRQPLLQQLPNKSKAAVAANSPAPAETLQASSMPTRSTAQVHCMDAGVAAATAGLQDASLQQQHTPASAAGLDMTRHASSTVLDISQLQPLQQQQQPGSHGSSSVGSAGHVRGGLPAAAAAAAVPDVLGLQCGDGTVAHKCSEEHHLHRHHRDRQAVHLNTHALAAPTHSHGG
jgi:hypothetical protein